MNKGNDSCMDTCINIINGQGFVYSIHRELSRPYNITDISIACIHNSNSGSIVLNFQPDWTKPWLYIVFHFRLALYFPQFLAPDAYLCGT